MNDLLEFLLVIIEVLSIFIKILCKIAIVGLTYMKFKTSYILFALFFSLFFSLFFYFVFFILKPTTNYKLNLQFTTNLQNNLIWIHNSNKHHVEFNFSLNDKFYTSLKDFITKNTQISNTEQRIINIFKVITQSIVHEKLFNEWGALPLVRLNSLGFAICGRQSEMLARISNLAKYKGRILHLNGHAVFEIYYNKKWHLFDPDRKIFFTIHHRVSSTDEFTLKADSLIQSYTPQKITHLTIYMPQYKKMFVTKNDNVIQTLEISKNDTFVINLPPHASFIFPYPPDYKTDFYPHNSKAKLFLPKNYSGTIKNPLVLIDVEGEGIVTYSKQNYNIPEQRELLKLAIFNSKKFIDNVKVEVKSDSLGLVYALNPLFTKFEKSNTFSLNASDTLILRLIGRKSTNSEIESMHIEYLDHYVDEAFEIMNSIDVSNIHSIDQLYAEQIIPYCMSKNIDSLLVKKRLNLIKQIVNEPLKNFKDESNLYAYLAVILYGKSCEFNPLFLSMYRYLKYKKIAKHYYSSKYFE